MVATVDIKEHMEVIGADGAFVGKVDKVEGERIKLTKDDGRGGRRDHHHFLPIGLVADIEGDKVRLSATAANALTFQEEESGVVVEGEATGSAQASAFAFENGAGDKADASAASTPVAAAAPPAVEAQKPVPVPPVATFAADTSQPKSKGLAVGAAALGAAAVGAAALGAAKLLKNRSEDETRDRAIPLDDDENMRLISSTKVEGTAVLDRAGIKVGTIQSVMIDKYTGRVAYAILSFGGAFGFGATLFPLPWNALDYDDDKDGYVLALNKDQLAHAPKFEARDTPEFDVGYRQRIVLFYRAM